MSAIQPQMLPSMLACKFACMGKQGLRKFPTLGARVHRHFVNKRRRSLRNFRPEVPVFKLEAENPDRSFVIAGHEIPARPYMLLNGRFIHFRSGPKHLATPDQVFCGGHQYLSHQWCFMGLSLLDEHL